MYAGCRSDVDVFSFIRLKVFSENIWTLVSFVPQNMQINFVARFFNNKHLFFIL
jgi:hypothetical protein